MSNTLTVDVLAADGKTSGSVDLPPEIFGVEVNVPLIHQVVVAQRAAARQGTHATKTRGQVRGGGAKPWRQKGTGRARHGSRRSPIWTGGGITFGPQPRSYAQRTPKKMVAAALRSILSDRAADGRVFVLESIVDTEVPSTKAAVQSLAQFDELKSVLVVLDRSEEIAWMSLRNVVGVDVIVADQLNTYDVVVNEGVVFTKAALESFISGPQPAEAVEASEEEATK